MDLLGRRLAKVVETLKLCPSSMPANLILKSRNLDFYKQWHFNVNTSIAYKDFYFTSPCQRYFSSNVVRWIDTGLIISSEGLTFCG